MRLIMWVALLASFAAAIFFQAKDLTDALQYQRVTPYFVLFFAFADSPHFFLTFLRTHLDKVEWLRHKIYHTVGFLVVFCVTAGAFLARCRLSPPGLAPRRRR